MQGAASNAVSRFWRPFLWGRNPSNRNSVAWQARGHQSRHKGGGAGQALDVDAGLHAGANEQESWVGNAWRAGVGAQRQGHPAFQLLDHARQGTVLVVLVKGPKRGVDAKVPQEFSRGSGVFCQDGMASFSTSSARGVMSLKLPTGVGTT